MCKRVRSFIVNMIKHYNVKKIDLKRLINVICILLIAFIYYLIKKYTKFSLICASNQIYGIYCFGCGNTRMIMSILEGDFYQAFRYNMVNFILLPLIVFITIRSTLEYIYGMDFNDCYVSRFCTKYTKIIVVVVIIWSFIRNIVPYFAPTQL